MRRSRAVLPGFVALLPVHGKKGHRVRPVALTFAAHQMAATIRSSYKEPDPINAAPEPSWWNMLIPFFIIIAGVILGYLGLV
jgi:hypothetical protein